MITAVLDGCMARALLVVVRVCGLLLTELCSSAHV